MTDGTKVAERIEKEEQKKDSNIHFRDVNFEGKKHEKT